jgi:mannosyl-3-phosphoglycerate phosphatase
LQRRRSSAISRRIRTLVFTDLDGTLLAHDSYSWAGALPALKQLHRLRVPLIFCTSKTRSEVHPLRRAIGNSDPFIVENGGLIVIPPGYFPLANSSRRAGAHVLMLGQPYQETVRALRTIAQQTRVRVRGFHQMSAEEVSRMTGLSLPAARRARQRESGEPFVFQNATPAKIRAFTRLAHKLGYILQCGGRFWHMSGGCDKGRAAIILMSFFRASEAATIRTIGLGDSGNDLPMLQAVDCPILVPNPVGSFDHDVTEAMPHILRAKQPGPAGWGGAVLEALRAHRSRRPNRKPKKVPRKVADPEFRYGT